MEHTHKMYLVPQHQLDALKHTGPRDSVRQTAENELDKAIESVLNRPDTDLHEKAAKYGAVLQRYLALVKQGRHEQGELTLSLSDAGAHARTPEAEHRGDDDAGDHIYDDIMKHLPTKSKRNAQHILESLKKSKNVSWTDMGEFVSKGETIKGSHMYDLLKNVTAPYHVLDSARPQGWNAFLKSLANNNVPSSSIPSKQLRQTVDMYKYTPSAISGTPVPDTSVAGKRRKRHQASPSFSSPRLHTGEWMSF